MRVVRHLKFDISVELLSFNFISFIINEKLQIYFTLVLTQYLVSFNLKSFSYFFLYFGLNFKTAEE